MKTVLILFFLSILSFSPVLGAEAGTDGAKVVAKQGTYSEELNDALMSTTTPIEVIKKIIASLSDADLMAEKANSYGDYSTVIGSAIWSNRPDAIKLLIERVPALKDAPVYNYLTPVMYAIFFQRKEALQFLIDAGSDLTAKDSDGLTVMYFALQNINNNDWDQYIIELLNQHEPTLKDQPNDSGRTTAMLAAQYGHLGYLHKLIDLKVDLTSRDKEGRTAMHYAANAEAAKLLLEKTQDLICSKDFFGRTPLMEALEENRVDVVRFLLDEATMNVLMQKDFFGASLTHYVRSKEALEALKEKSKLDLNAKDNKGRTLLHWLALRGNEDAGLKDMLIAEGADLNLRTKHGFSDDELFEWSKKPSDVLVGKISEEATITAANDASNVWDAMRQNKFLYAVTAEKAMDGFQQALFKTTYKTLWTKDLWKVATAQLKTLAGELGREEWFKENFPTQILQNLYLMSTFPEEDAELRARLNTLRTTVLTTGGDWGLNMNRTAKGRELQELIQMAREIGCYKSSQMEGQDIADIYKSLAEDLILAKTSDARIIRHQTIAYVFAAKAAFRNPDMNVIVQAANARLSEANKITLEDMNQTLGRIYKRMCPSVKVVTERALED